MNHLFCINFYVWICWYTYNHSKEQNNAPSLICYMPPLPTCLCIHITPSLVLLSFYVHYLRSWYLCSVLLSPFPCSVCRSSVWQHGFQGGEKFRTSHNAKQWRLDFFSGYLRGWIYLSTQYCSFSSLQKPSDVSTYTAFPSCL